MTHYRVTVTLPVWGWLLLAAMIGVSLGTCVWSAVTA